MSKIVFIKYVTSPKPFESYLMAHCPQKLDGDWLNDPPDLDTCERFLREAVNDLHSNGVYHYCNPVEVIREKNCVYAQSRGIVTGVLKKICGYKVSDSLIMN